MSYDISALYPVIAEEAILGIMVVHSSDMKSIYVNRIARDVLEISPDVKPEDITIESMKPERVREGYRAFSDELLSLEGLIRDVMVQKSDQSLFIADIGVKHLRIGSEEYHLIMFQDVTIQKKLQREIQMKQQELHDSYQELLEQNRQLKELDVAKDKFITLTTHELRTPISAIFATAEVLKNKFYDTDEQRDEFVDMIYDQSIHIQELVNDILDFAKIQAGKMDFYIQQTDIRNDLDLIMSNFETTADKTTTNLIYEPLDPPVTCYYDSVRMGEVFNNVIGNALKFTKEGEVKVSISQVENMVRVTVADTGPGIPDELKDKVFNEFETVGSINTHQKGTGLGMPISLKIMKQMGGDLRFESEVGKGTTFYIEVPTEMVLDESEYKDRPEQVVDLLDTV